MHTYFFIINGMRISIRLGDDPVFCKCTDNYKTHQVYWPRIYHD